MRFRIAAGALLGAAFAVTFALDPWADELVTDVTLYEAYARLFLDGRLPYRDVAFEYPPLAAPLIALPGLLSDGYDGYRAAFGGMAVLLGLGLMLSTGRLARLTGGDERRALLAVAVAPLLTGAMIRTHFDLAPVLLAVLGIGAIASERVRTGFALLGLGGALKVFPLAAAVVAVGWLAGRGRAREALAGVAIAAAIVAAAVIAAVALSPGGAWDAVDYHLGRPVQIESLPATLLNGWDALGGEAPQPVEGHKSDGLKHRAAGALEALFAILLCAAIAAFALLARRLPDPRGFVLAALGAIAAFATLGKVLSPQFMVWLVPLWAVAFAWQMRALAIAVALATALTLTWFPASYFSLVAREEGPVLMVGIRNALLVAALVMVFRAVAGWRSPSHPLQPRSPRR